MDRAVPCSMLNLCAFGAKLTPVRAGLASERSIHPKLASRCYYNPRNSRAFLASNCDRTSSDNSIDSISLPGQASPNGNG